MDNQNEKLRIKEWMRPHEVELRSNAVAYIEKAIQLKLLPDNDVSSFEAFSKGESSVVFKVETKSGPYVVKMRNKEEDRALAEAYFYRMWRQNGVRTPRVFLARQADEEIPVSLSVMEYIDAPVLSEKMVVNERIKSGLSKEMGRVLAKMHQVKGNGFGYPVGNNFFGSHKTFGEQMFEELKRRKILLLKQEGIISNGDADYARKAINVIENDGDTLPSLTHYDYGAYNIFATHPLTIFDPNPCFTHPVMDLALALITPTVTDHPQEGDQILAGYKEVNPMSDRVVSAGIVLRGLMKARTWSRKKLDNRMQRLIPLIREHGKKL